MRRTSGWALVVLAALALVGGAATAVVLGPNDRVWSDPEPLDTDSSVVVTAPDALTWAGPVIQVEATLPDDRPVFVALGNAVDVSDYTAGVSALVVDSVTVPFDLEADEVEGDRSLPGDPLELDWWLATAGGEGDATVSFQLPPTPSQIMVTALDGGDLDGLRVAASYQLDGGFGIGLGLLGIGAGLAMFGWVALRRPQTQPDRASDPRFAGMVAAVALLVATGGCAALRPVEGEPVKVAVTPAEADQVLVRWADRRADALQTLDAAALSSVEGGATLAVDQTALAVARRLIAPGSQDAEQQLDLRSVMAPRLSSYPMWFVAVVDDGQRELTKVSVHARASAAAPWQLVSTAEVLPSTQLPQLQLDADGALEPLGPGDLGGLDATPQQIAVAYSSMLDDPTSTGDELVLADSFVDQMRTIATAQGGLDDVRFSQSWRAEPVEWAVRTSDGGALVFATMSRSDRYRITSDVAVDWPDGSDQAAFFAGRVLETAVLRYLHQVLLYVPPAGGGQARALGQYGGVVSASGT